jgi:hypothetical protein
MSISFLHAASINHANHVRVRRLNAMRCGETFSIGQAVSKEVRRSSITLRRDGLDAITIRDQLPLKFLDECLEEGVARQDFLDAPNGRVFFWLAEERLQRLLNARAYRSRPHLIMQIDTGSLLDEERPSGLSSINRATTSESRAIAYLGCRIRTCAAPSR